MGRHEIRLRRHKMTSRRIEGHKNYYDVMKKHQRGNRMKRLIRIIVLLLFFSFLLLFIFNLSEIFTNADSKAIKTYQNSGFEIFKIVGSEGDTIFTLSGSEIMVPKSAFLDRNGNKVEDTVMLAFKEYRNAIDIALSGIAMRISDSVMLESRGMFSLEAFQEGNLLKANSENRIRVNYLNRIHDADYKNYYLNNQEKWEEVRSEKVKTRFKILGNYSVFPELEPLKDIEWEFFGPVNDSSQNSLFTLIYDDPILKENDTFFDLSLSPYVKVTSVTLSYGPDSTIYSFQGDELEADTTIAAEPSLDFRIKNVNGDISKFYSNYIDAYEKRNIKELENKTDSIGNFTEAFSSEMAMNVFYLDDFGTWNCDRPFPLSDYLVVDPTFINTKGEELEYNQIIAINESINTVFRFSKEEMKFQNGGDYKLFCITEDNTLYHSSVKIDSKVSNIEMEEVKLKEVSTYEIAKILNYDIEKKYEDQVVIIKRQSDLRPKWLEGKNVIWFDRPSADGIK
ncbi:MAG: hypothetical protein AAF600_21005 [Bacteroidota bacterium]